MLITTRETLRTPKEHLYRRRQAIVEHPYGTIKRQWGFSYILTKKGRGRAISDVGFMLVAYNLRRIGNILTLKALKEYLGMLVSFFLAIIGLTEAVLRHLGAPGTLRPEFVSDVNFPGSSGMQP